MSNNYYDIVSNLIDTKFPASAFGWTDCMYTYASLEVYQMSRIKITQSGKFNVFGSTYTSAYIELFHNHTIKENILYIAEVRFFDPMTDDLYVIQYPFKTSILGFDRDEEEDVDDEDREGEMD